MAEARAAPGGLSLPPEEAEALSGLLEDIADVSGDLAPVFRGLAEGKDMRSALGLPPGVADLLYAQGFARFEAGDGMKAARLFQGAALLAPDRADIWLALGVALVGSGAREGGVLALRAAAGIDPRCGPAHLHLARVHMADDEPDAARDALRAFRASRRDAGRIALEAQASRMASALGMRDD